MPAGYDEKKEYPLLVMHDGQNLFYDSLSFAGEWRVDEILDSLHKNESMAVIAVGIENGGENRIDELTMFANGKYGGGNGRAYLNYLEKELLPVIKENYSISSTRADHVLLGSSLGGLITFYHAFSDASSFGNYGVYSPSLWFTDDVFSMAEEELTYADKMVMMISENEDDEHLNVLKMDSLLNKTQKVKLKTDIYEIGEHKEWFWSEHLYHDLLWLLKEE